MTEQERDLLERVMGSWDEPAAALEFRVSALPHDLPVTLPTFASQQVVGSMTRRVRQPGGVQRWEVHVNAVAPAHEVLRQLDDTLTRDGWAPAPRSKDPSALVRRWGDLHLHARTQERRGLTELALRVIRTPQSATSERPALDHSA